MRRLLIVLSVEVGTSHYSVALTLDNAMPIAFLVIRLSVVGANNLNDAYFWLVNAGAYCDDAQRLSMPLKTVNMTCFISGK